MALALPLVTVVPYRTIPKAARLANMANLGKEGGATHREDHVVLVLDDDGALGISDSFNLLVLAEGLTGQDGLVQRDDRGFDGNHTTVSRDLVSN